MGCLVVWPILVGMEKRLLGPSDLAVSVFGLGTMTFGHESDEATSHAILDRYVEAGGVFIDTADVYSRGISEEIIGRWLAKRAGAEGVEIATKARFAMSDDPADRGAGREHLERALEASLRRLGGRQRRPLPNSRLGSGNSGRGDHGDSERFRRGGKGEGNRCIEFPRMAVGAGCHDRSIS